MANEDNEAAAQWLANNILTGGSAFLLGVLTQAGLNNAQKLAIANTIKSRMVAEQLEPELKEKLRALELRGVTMTRVKQLADEVDAETP